MDGSKPLDENRHEEFAKFCAKGKEDAEAYRLAGFKGSDHAKRAWDIRKRQEVSQRIEWLKRASATALTLTSQEKREFLALSVRTAIGQVDENHVLCQSMKRKRLMGSEDEDGWEVEEIKAVDKLNAIKIDNEMSGDNAPQKHEVTVDADKLEWVRKIRGR